MSTFRVGQRVKIIGCANLYMMQHIGKTGVLASVPEYPNMWFVRDDEGTIPAKCVWAQHRLVPVTKPKETVLSWEDPRCVWKPEHLRVEA